MDAVTLAISGVALIVPYLAKAGEAIAEKTGQAVWDSFAGKAKALYESLKAKFAGDEDAATALKQLENKPHSEGRQAALKEVLEEKIQADPTFAEMLRQLIAEVKQSGGDTITQTLTMSGGQVGKVTQIGKARDVDIS